MSSLTDRKKNIRWIVRNDTDELSDLATQVLVDLLMNTARPVIGFATGGTPQKLYGNLVRRSQKDAKLHRRWQDVIGFNLDEYVGLGRDHPQSYHRYMWEHVYRYLLMAGDHVYIPKGTGDLVKNCQEYDDALEFYGWPDIQIVGIGANGHIGFNEPGNRLELRTHVTQLSDATRGANARFFGQDTVPAQAVTMGIADILRAKSVMLLAFGEAKRAALKKAFSGSIDTMCPASFLQLHDHVTIFTDLAT